MENLPQETLLRHVLSVVVAVAVTPNPGRMAAERVIVVGSSRMREVVVQHTVPVPSSSPIRTTRVPVSHWKWVALEEPVEVQSLTPVPLLPWLPPVEVAEAVIWRLPLQVP